MHRLTKHHNSDWLRRSAIPTLLLSLLSAVNPAPASGNSSTQDQVDTALSEIAELRAALSEMNSPAPNRHNAIAELLKAKRQLCADFPNDQRLPLWQGDLAFDLLFLAGAEGARDLIIEFGLPSALEWTHFQALADEANALTDDAAAGMADLVLDIEDTDDFQTSAKLQQQRRQLVNDELRKRLPYLSATAQYYQAIASGPRPQLKLADKSDLTSIADPAALTEQRKRLSEVELLAEDLELVLEEPYRTRLRVLAGAAAYQRGEPDLGERRFARAESSINLSPSARMRILLTRRRAKSQTAAVADPKWLRLHPFWLLLRCDFEFREQMEDDSVSQQISPEWNQQLTAYAPFLNSRDLSLSKNARERAVGEQISHALPTSLPVDELPAIVLVAQASKQITDPSKRTAAVASLQAIIERTGLADWVEPRARYLIATALLADERTLESAEAFFELAKKFPLNDDGLLGLEQALIILTNLLKDTPEPDANEDANQLFELASSLALRDMQKIANFEQWMYLRGRFALRQSQYKSALEALSLVTTDSKWYLRATIKIAETYYHDALTTPQRAIVATPPHWEKAVSAGAAAQALLQNELTHETNPETRAWLTNSLDTTLALLADAHLKNHHPAAALATIAGLNLHTSISGRRPSTVADLLRIRIDALLALEQNNEAEAELQALADDAPARALPILTRMVAGLYTELLQRELTGKESDAVVEGAVNRLIPLTKLALSVTQQLKQIENSADPIEYSTNRNILRFHAGEAYRLAGQFNDAKRILLELKLDQPNSADVLTAYAECCFQLQDDAEALRSFSRVSHSLINDRSWRFWLAELRTLQIFARTKKRTERIFPRVQRLRLYDPQLGGVRFQNEFMQLESRHTP